VTVSSLAKPREPRKPRIFNKLKAYGEAKKKGDSNTCMCIHRFLCRLTDCFNKIALDLFYRVSVTQREQREPSGKGSLQTPSKKPPKAALDVGRVQREMVSVSLV
jgi:hypothetical protein